jgi:hypothetical protein
MEIQHFSTYKQESMGNIRQENIRQIDFILRGFEEQHTIVAEANLTRTDRLRQAVLRVAFCGRQALTESNL